MKIRTCVATFLSVLCFSIDCSGREPAGGSLCEEGDPVAIERWQYFRAHLGKGGIERSDLDQEAYSFFVDLVGVKVRYNWGHFGGLADEQTAKDLRLLDEWFEKNCWRLRWDEYQAKVWVAEPGRQLK